MKRLELKRVSNSRKCTMGVILDTSTGLPLIVSLELPYRMNQQFISGIPSGIYLCIPFSSDKYKRAFHLQDVPARENVLIHKGNTVNDTTGCIITGTYFGEYKGLPAVVNSKDAFKVLSDYVNNESFELMIN